MFNKIDDRLNGRIAQIVKDYIYVVHCTPAFEEEAKRHDKQLKGLRTEIDQYKTFYSCMGWDDQIREVDQLFKGLALLLETQNTLLEKKEKS